MNEITTLKQLLKLPVGEAYSRIASYSEWNLIRDRIGDRKHITPAERTARRLIKRGLLKPEGEWAEKGYEIVRINNIIYSVPKRYIYRAPPETLSKVQVFKETRTERLRDFVTGFFFSRTILAVNLQDDTTPFILAEPGTRKYSRKTTVHGYTNWPSYFKESTQEFLVLSAEREYEVVDDITLRKVTGWWKSDIKVGYHYPEQAWLAVSGKTRTITKSRNTAITGLRTRITNKVMSSIAA